ncbi:hypothetical protein JW964_07915 [candidate division KSB1 bacterium]|nr:hypothetical protein [candidate division KSB1 bacterium]
MRLKSLFKLMIIGIWFLNFNTNLKADDSVLGNFTNGLLSLTIKGDKDGSDSHIMLNGQSYRVVVEQNFGNSFEGFYQFQGKNFLLRGKIEGQMLSLFIDGVNLTLQRQKDNMGDVHASPQSDVKKAAANQNVNSSTPLYMQGDEIGDEFLGFKFVPPAGWTAQKVPGGFLLTSATQKGFILVATHQYRTLDAIRMALKDGWSDAENGTQFVLNGQIEAFSNQGISAEFAGTIQWNQARAKIVTLLSPYSDGVTILVAVENASYSSEYANYAGKIARSVKFAIPKTSPETKQWQEKLKGSRLTFMESYSSNSGGGYNMQEVYSLCQNGNFNYQGNSTVSVDVPGASGSSVGNGGGQGQWKVVTIVGQPTLRLEFNNGQIKEFTITNPDNKLHLNGKRYFLTYNPDCH